jgi:predicted RNA binding protein YcfA (HicA-like mRNA interferase family)
VTSWPRDAPRANVIAALRELGFEVVRVGGHISLAAAAPDGTRQTMTIPNHPRIKGSTLRTACTVAGIERDEFLAAYCRR